MINLTELTVTTLTSLTVLGVASAVLWLAMEVWDYTRGRC